MNKKGFAFAWDNLLWLILALIGLITLIALVYLFGQGGLESIGQLGNI